MKTCIAIHGCHLEAKGWEHIVWGEPEAGVLGRVPRALKLWQDLNGAASLHWGTGGSWQDGMCESQFTYQFALEWVSSLPFFSNREAGELTDAIAAASILDTKTQNTQEEIEAALAVPGIERLILVSSPTHLPRCLQTAASLRQQQQSGVDIHAVPSDTCYAGPVPNDVAIIEPPHRGDNATMPFNALAKRFIPFYRRPDIAEDVYNEVDAVLRKWEEKV